MYVRNSNNFYNISHLFIECLFKSFFLKKEALERLNVIIKTKDESNGWGQQEDDECDLKTLFGLKFVFSCRLSLLYKDLNRLVEANILASHSLEIAKFHLADSTSSIDGRKVIRTQNPVQASIFSALNECIYSLQDQVQVVCDDHGDSNERNDKIGGVTAILSPKIYSIQKFKEIRDVLIKKDKATDHAYLLSNEYAKSILSGLVLQRREKSSDRNYSNSSYTLPNNSNNSNDGDDDGGSGSSSRSCNSGGGVNNRRRIHNHDDYENNSNITITSKKKVIIHANKRPKTSEK